MDLFLDDTGAEVDVNPDDVEIITQNGITSMIQSCEILERYCSSRPAHASISGNPPVVLAFFIPASIFAVFGTRLKEALSSS